MSLVTIGPDISKNLVSLEARHEALSTQRSDIHARVRSIEEALPELRDLAGEVEDRIRAQEGEVFRARKAAGELISFGSRHNERPVFMTYGGKTEQLTGPRPLDTPGGRLDHATRVLEALQAEAQPVRASLNSLERERDELVKTAGLIGGEIEGVQQQIGRIRAEEAERAQLLGEHLSWRDRLAGILRRLMHGVPAPSIEELRTQGKSVRQIAALTGLSKSQVQRELTAAGVPLGTDEMAESA